MSYNNYEDWQQQSPAWRDKEIHNCLCGIKDALETIYANQPKVYRALLTQSGTNAPTAIVLENTLGETPTFSYSNDGEYTLNTVGNVFTQDKTFITYAPFPVVGIDVRTFQAVRNNQTVVDLRTYNAGALTNDMILNSAIEILVYP